MAGHHNSELSADCGLFRAGPTAYQDASWPDSPSLPVGSLMLIKNVVAGAAGVIICTSSLTPLFLHSFGCDPYDRYLSPPPPDPSTGVDNPYPIDECFSSPILPFGGPAPVVCWVIALVSLFLTARFAAGSNERIALGVGIAGPLIAALIGFSISGLDPAMVLTDLDFYSALALTSGLGLIFGQLERRRCSN
jgi:hypothetical protein